MRYLDSSSQGPTRGGSNSFYAPWRVFSDASDLVVGCWQARRLPVDPRTVGTGEFVSPVGAGRRSGIEAAGFGPSCVPERGDRPYTPDDRTGRCRVGLGFRYGDVQSEEHTSELQSPVH